MLVVHVVVCVGCSVCAVYVGFLMVSRAVFVCVGVACWLSVLVIVVLVFRVGLVCWFYVLVFCVGFLCGLNALSVCVGCLCVLYVLVFVWVV